MRPTQETITFEFFLSSVCWNQPPRVAITVDDVEAFSGAIPAGNQTVKFSHTCKFGEPHRLTMIRSGKDSGQAKFGPDGEWLDQILTLEKLKIDGVDIRNIVWSQSITVSDYPEPWASEQLALGNVLEQEAIGVTTFGHNGVWYLDFTSPFYNFIMQWMGGGKN